MTYGTVLPADLGTSVCIAGMDFETYSEAGYVWDEAAQRWRGPPNAASGKRGLPVVGAAVYAEHPTTEVLSFAYDLRDGHGVRTWNPGMPNPQPLFDHLAAGKLVGAWNAPFEIWIWTKVCQPRYGWPPLPIRQIRCTMAKSRAAGYPGSLGAAGDAMGLPFRKDKEGERLLDKFSVPRAPTRKDSRVRIRPVDDPEDFRRLVAYNVRDVVVEMQAAERLPDLSPIEQEVWFLDREINTRGIAIDRAALANCVSVIEQVYARYDGELNALAGCRASETQKLRRWLAEHGLDMDSLDAEHLEDALTRLRNPTECERLVADATNPAYLDALIHRHSIAEDKPLKEHLAARIVGIQGRTAEELRRRLRLALRALEIRDLTSSASVKKLYAIRNALADDGRLHDLFSIYGARTGRWTGNGPQPTNLPTSGPPVVRCACNRHYAKCVNPCPWCGGSEFKATDWSADAAADALDVIATRSLELVEAFFGDTLYAVSGCLRGLFVAAEGHDLICSDYSAIEAVGLAELAGEEWRREVFRTHGKIYEMSAAKISGVPFEDFLKHKKETGQHHPLRKKLGKVAELASGYGGWIGAWKAFGAEEYFTDDEIKEAILGWRAASPAITALWGGQRNGYPSGLEGMAILAVRNPDRWTQYRDVYFICKNDALFMRLPSGRVLTYRHPRIEVSEKRQDQLQLTYMTWNSNPKMGAMGWVRMGTYGGRLTENLVQAACRELLVYAMLRLNAAGYRIVQHVYDEIAAEVPHGFGSIEEFERIMSEPPEFASEWPIRASGGWRGRRYRKD